MEYKLPSISALWTFDQVVETPVGIVNDALAAGWELLARSVAERRVRQGVITRR